MASRHRGPGGWAGGFEGRHEFRRALLEFTARCSVIENRPEVMAWVFTGFTAFAGKQRPHYLIRSTTIAAGMLGPSSWR